MNKQELVERIESNTVNIEEVRKTLIEVIKHLDKYGDIDFSAWLSEEETDE